MKNKKFFLSLFGAASLIATGCSSTSDNTEFDRPSAVYSLPVEDIETQQYLANKKQTQKRNIFSTNFEAFEAKQYDKKNENYIPLRQKISSKTYIVKKNDTIFGIAKREHVNPSELMEVNNLTTKSILQIGQKLTLPLLSSTSVVKHSKSDAVTSKTSGIIPVAAGAQYTVKKGDVLGSIAKAHKISVASIKAENNLHSDKIIVGQKLRISNGEKTVTNISKKIETNYKNHKINNASSVIDSDGLYTIKEGDTLEKVAKTLNINQAALADTNGLNNNSQLQIGKKLLIPTNSQQIDPTFDSLLDKPTKMSTQKPTESGTKDTFFDDLDDIPVIELK